MRKILLASAVLCTFNYSCFAVNYNSSSASRRSLSDDIDICIQIHFDIEGNSVDCRNFYENMEKEETEESLESNKKTTAAILVDVGQHILLAKQMCGSDGGRTNVSSAYNELKKFYNVRLKSLLRPIFDQRYRLLEYLIEDNSSLLKRFLDEYCELIPPEEQQQARLIYSEALENQRRTDAAEQREAASSSSSSFGPSSPSLSSLSSYSSHASLQSIAPSSGISSVAQSARNSVPTTPLMHQQTTFLATNNVREGTPPNPTNLYETWRAPASTSLSQIPHPSESVDDLQEQFSEFDTSIIPPTPLRGSFLSQTIRTANKTTDPNSSDNNTAATQASSRSIQGLLPQTLK